MPPRNPPGDRLLGEFLEETEDLTADSRRTERSKTEAGFPNLERSATKRNIAWVQAQVAMFWSYLLTSPQLIGYPLT